MQSLSQFYDFMDSTQTVRRMITGYCLIQAHHGRHVESLENALAAMDKLPGESIDKRLDAAGRTVTVTIDYERNELEKDIYFLTHSDGEFLDYLSRLHDGFADEVAQTLRFLRAHQIRTFVSDRDGTVNNYCGRYRSSHQSVWNAVYLTQFVSAVPAAPVLLTSAPLFNGGLIAMSAMPEHTTHYGGSSGREFCDRDGNRGALDLSDDQARAIEKLNERIDRLLSRPEFAT
ncbi:MAG: trehalose 6-phosphate synthase, partial [Spirochaetaceae bacterium]